MTGASRNEDDRGDDSRPGDGPTGTRRATVETAHVAPDVVAAALRPDNTDEMHTSVREDRVHTRITRTSSGGLASTVDDYVVNLDVADRVVEHANQPTTPTHDTS